MYQIRYKDPMTGTILEAQAHSLDEAAVAIKKAKDDLYYRGHSLQKDEPVPQEDAPSQEDANLCEDESSDDKDQTEDDMDDPDDFLYPYGVTLW